MKEVESLVNHINIDSITDSQEGFTTAATWIRQCNDSHAFCSARLRAGRRLPTRLLDIGETSTTSYIKLIPSSSLPWDTKYLALSHCWGSKPVYKLTTVSASSLYRGIEISHISRTFQHAVSIAKEFQRLFGVRYLWIDSLCIIQDSVEDWQSESAIMGEVYQNAFCTIAATASSDSDGGLFFERDPLRRKPCLLTFSSKGLSKRTFLCVDQNDWKDNISRAPLNSRSWVLQERLLSPRVLHFAAHQLYWECAALEASEVFPVRLPEGFGEKIKNWLQHEEWPEENPRDAYTKWEKDRAGIYFWKANQKL
jgi:hypothetical protein